MNRILLLTACLLLLGAAPAQARRTLSLHDGRARIARAVTYDIADQVGATGGVRSCWRRSRRTVSCWIREQGVEAWGIDDWTLDLVYSTRRGSSHVTIG